MILLEGYIVQICWKQKKIPGGVFLSGCIILGWETILVRGCENAASKLRQGRVVCNTPPNGIQVIFPFIRTSLGTIFCASGITCDHTCANDPTNWWGRRRNEGRDKGEMISKASLSWTGDEAKNSIILESHHRHTIHSWMNECDTGGMRGEIKEGW